MAVDEMSRIERSIEIKATPERVWRALTRTEALSTWFQVRIEGELAPGADVWMTSTVASHAGQRFQVKVTAMEAPRRLVWEWHPGEVDPAVDYAREPWTTVTFQLEPSPGGTRLTVQETGFDRIALARRAKVYRDNTQGWTEVVEWLRRYVEETPTA